VKLYVGQDSLPVSFVEYVDEAQSTQAMNALRGAYLGPTRLRIEYARSKMSSGKQAAAQLPLSNSTGAVPKHRKTSTSSNLQTVDEGSVSHSAPTSGDREGLPLLSGGKLTFGSLF